MSQEIKILEVDPEEESSTIELLTCFGWRLKSSQQIYSHTKTPVSAIGIENVTFIQSQTETINYVKLIFERETHIPNAAELIELEEEFWDLADDVNEKRPLPPAPLIEFEEWVKENKPSVMSRKEIILITAISTLVLTVILHGLIYFSLPLAALITFLYAKIRFMTGLKHTDSKGYKAMQKAYELYKQAHQQQLNTVSRYDYAAQRIPQILREAEALLHSNN